MSNTGAVYIASVDAKDLYLANNMLNQEHSEYRLRKQNGSYNLNRFNNSLDYSLDLIKLRQVYDETYTDDADSHFSFPDPNGSGKEYTPHVINVTFKYAVKLFNQTGKNIYVRNGYNIRELHLGDDCLCFDKDGQLLAIQVGVDVEMPKDLELPKYFGYKKSEKEINGHYYVKSLPVLKTRAELREWIYKNGFMCDGIHYVRFKRSSGSARRGVCNFINEALYPAMNEWAKCGLDIQDGMKIDLAGYESYIALTASSIIDTLEIDPSSILLIDDYKSEFTDKVMATREVDGHLETKPETITVSNKIWDGQSLIDVSAMGDYSKYGMLLLRNRFFKSCCFNTNIQQWFKDNGITDISQLKGQTRATRIEDIKLITTPSSIKYLKFGKYEDWLDNIDSTFGIVKHEKKTHYFGGEMVSTHYQLLNTLQLSYEETEEFLQPSIDYIMALRDDPAVLRDYIKSSPFDDNAIIGVENKNDIIFALMNCNERFTKTKIYAEFARTLVKSQFDNVKLGHVLVKGCYVTLCGNPISMLRAAIGTFDGTSELGVGNLHTKFFPYGQDILGSRSPHVSMGNVLVEHNVANELIDKYMNLTPEICCLNSINENIMARLSGSDYDSDTMLITNNPILLKAAKRNYDQWLVPTGLVEADKANRYYTDEQKADLDVKTSVNKIGEIINFSQVLNSVLWDNVYSGQTIKENQDLYADIAQLDVCSNIEIDKAKKVFNIDMGKELNALRDKYDLRDEDGKKINPKFFMHVSKKKHLYIKGKKSYIQFHTTMDYVQQVVNKAMYQMRYKHALGDEPLSVVLDDSMYSHEESNRKQITTIETMIRNTKIRISALYSDDLTYSERTIMIDRIKYGLKVDLNSMTINKSTAYEFLNKLDRNSCDSDIKNMAFYLILSLPRLPFVSVFAESKGPYSVIVKDNNNPDCYYYGYGYRHISVNQNSEYLR